jgi:hypothetical protein
MADEPVSNHDHGKEKAMLAGFQRELWDTGTKMNESSFNLAQIGLKGKSKRLGVKQKSASLLTSRVTFYTHK